MAPKLTRIAGFLLAVCTTAASAAPNIPSSELPGRDRQRFMDSPIQRFTDPLATPRNTEPLWRWDCDGQARPKNRKQKRGC
jgi:hypothetical protein